jgi:hypothetical protein
MVRDREVLMGKSVVQRVVKAIVPDSVAADMEKESRQWIARCNTCGHETSVWDMGGIRWKASGSPRRLLACKACGRNRMHTVSKRGA